MESMPLWVAAAAALGTFVVVWRYTNFTGRLLEESRLLRELEALFKLADLAGVGTREADHPVLQALSQLLAETWHGSLTEDRRRRLRALLDKIVSANPAV